MSGIFVTLRDQSIHSLRTGEQFQNLRTMFSKRGPLPSLALAPYFWLSMVLALAGKIHQRALPCSQWELRDCSRQKHIQSPVN